MAAARRLLTSAASKAARLPMAPPMAGVTLFDPPALGEPKYKVTKLPNGLRVASENTPGPSTAISLFLDCGSVYEMSPLDGDDPRRACGSTSMLERMAFKSTGNRTDFRLVRELEALGAVPSAVATREQLAYSVNCLRTQIGPAVEILLDSVANAALFEWEVKQQANAAMEVLAQEKNGDSEEVKAIKSFERIEEMVHGAAFQGGLANPLYATESSLKRMAARPGLVKEFANATWCPSRMVLAASGVDHEELVEICKPIAEAIAPKPAGALISPFNSVYTGGEWKVRDDGGNEMDNAAHIFIGFGGLGGWRDDKKAIQYAVLQIAMGGGASFSAGGPGKGMCSRIYQRVLNQYAWAQQCSAQVYIHNDAHIFGIYGKSDPSAASRMVDAMTSEFQAIANGTLTEEEVERAKKATSAGVHMGLECKAIVAEDIGRQIITYGERKDTSECLKIIEGITPKSLTALAKDLLKQPMTLVAAGSSERVPTYSQIEKRFT